MDNIWSKYIASVKKLQLKNKNNDYSSEESAIEKLKYHSYRNEVDVNNENTKHRGILKESKYFRDEKLEYKTERILLKYKTLGIDKNTRIKIDKGKYAIDLTLDLHMHHRMQAYIMLEKTIIYAFENNMRMLLLITGKGSATRPSILRALVPQWLTSAPMSNYVIYHHVAQVEHGGMGAFYVFIKKQK